MGDIKNIFCITDMTAIDARTLRDHIFKMNCLLYSYSNSACGYYDQSLEPMLLYCRALMEKKLEEILR